MAYYYCCYQGSAVAANKKPKQAVQSSGSAVGFESLALIAPAKKRQLLSQRCVLAPVMRAFDSDSKQLNSRKYKLYIKQQIQHSSGKQCKAVPDVEWHKMFCASYI